ncbi:MAG: ammonium transporter, partial [Chloroflexota bacterium]
MSTKELLDITWILICAGLVMFMQPGFSTLESGLVRTKNSVNVAAKNFADFCLSSGIYWAFGFAFMFGASVNGLFGFSDFAISDTDNVWQLAFFLFQLGFASTATTIVSGAVAERMRFYSYLTVAFIMSAVIYPVYGHWVWGSAAGGDGGWLEALGFIDFAGSTVVHSIGGWMALASIIILGPRLRRFGKDAIPIHGHDLPLVTLGVFILWFGWIGFNGGSTLGLTDQVPGIIVNTFISGAFGGIVALALSEWRSKQVDVSLMMNGGLAGLVGVTASANLVTPIQSAVIGVVSGIVMYIVVLLLERFEIDDAVGAVPVHLAAGIWGTLAVALFADPEVWGGASRLSQLGIQGIGVFAAFIWSFGLGYVLLSLVNRKFPLRIDPEGERIGLNVAEHGASTEILDLLTEMDSQRKSDDYSTPVNVEPHTEVGQIAKQYNIVLEAINKQTASLQLMQKTATSANEAVSIESVMNTVISEICKASDWDVGHVFMVDESDPEKLNPTSSWYLSDPKTQFGLEVAFEKAHFRLGEGLPGKVLLAKEPAWFDFEDQKSDYLMKAAVSNLGLKSGFAAPVLVGEDVVAVLEFFSQSHLEPDADFLDVMATIGTELGRVVERTRSEEQRFQTVLDNMPAMVELRDLDGKFILVNEKYEDFYRLPEKEIIGKTLEEVSDFANLNLNVQESYEQDNEVIKTQATVEKEISLTRTGEVVTLTSLKFPITNLNHEVVAVGGFELDITERKELEDQLEKANDLMSEELNFAKEIQISLLPLIYPDFATRSEFNIYAQVIPAREVGGDFYDFYFLDEDHLCFVIGDVSGKGAPGALLMAVSKTLIKSRAVDDLQPSTILNYVNNELSENNESAMFVTTFLAVLDIRSGVLEYSNAGHNPPYIIRSDREVEKLDEFHGPIIGAMPKLTFEQSSIVLKQGDTVLLHTDGVTEAMNPDEILFSNKRYEEILKSNPLLTPQKLIDKVIEEVKLFEDDSKQADDITMLALQYYGSRDTQEADRLELKMKNNLKAIADVEEKFERFSKKHQISNSDRQKVSIVLDELLNNIVTYAFKDEAEHIVDIELIYTGNRLVIKISDEGIPFNPFEIDAKDVSSSLDNSSVGGLGIVLVRGVMDEY